MTEEKFYNSLNLICESDYKKLAKLKERFLSWEAAWNNLVGKAPTPAEDVVGVPTASRVGKKSNRDPDDDWRRIEKLGVELIMKESEKYPALLKEIPHPPFGIYVLGNPSASPLSAFFSPTPPPALAIVGTRKATFDGKELAKKFSAELSRRGIIIVSGLALGIDAAAHAGCLEERGRAIAVLASGLDYIYPRTNESLAKKILEGGGVIISEYPPGTSPLPYRFLERNRIVSGLARGILIIEAPEHSGSLATARFALDQNREIFVVPGPVSHPNFKGSHQLIRAGAELITKTEEILEALGLADEGEEKKMENFETAEEKIIYDTLKKFSRPATVDKIIEMTNLKTSDVNQALTFLIIKNIIKETDSGYITEQ